MEIGGFLDLELRGDVCFHPQASGFNTNRNALQYLLEHLPVAQVFIPYYTCGVVLEAVVRARKDYAFYSLNTDLSPIDIPSRLNQEQILIYPHLWGINGQNIRRIIAKYSGQVIIDAAQAFYYRPLKGEYCINSCRKFFGVPDGAFLYADIKSHPLEYDRSCERFAHLLKRYELGAKESYQDYLTAEANLSEIGIKRMSKLTLGLLSLIDYEIVKDKRLNNYRVLHDHLKSRNKLNLDALADDIDVPMVYPFWTDDINLREKLLQHKIYVATYWPNIFDWCEENQLEYKFAKEIIPLPIDQRYDKKDMNFIISVVNGNI